MATKEEEEKVITATYKLNLHCAKCAEDIKKPLLRIPGVQSVDANFEKGEVIVKGPFDEKEMHKRLEKMSKQTVEIVEKPKTTKEKKVRVTTIKAYLHCNKCEDGLRKKLLKQKGIHDVKIDAKAQTVTIQGDVEPEKLLTFMRERVHKHAEIIPPKQEKKVEKKIKDEKKDPEEKEKEKEKEKREKDVEKKNKALKAYTVQVKNAETRRVFEFKDERQVEGRTPQGQVPYFVHYVYAPQTFSDENPNACSVM